MAKFPPRPKETKAGQFLQIGPGNSVIGVFAGDPVVQYRIFENTKYKVVEKGTNGSTFSFLYNFIVNENGALVSKIFRGNWYDFDALETLNNEYPLENVYIKISQTGEKKTKRLTFLPMLKQTPPQDKIRKVQLHELEAKKPSDLRYDSSPNYTNDPDDPGPGENFDDDIPF